MKLKKISEVKDGYLKILKSNPPILSITAQGVVPTGGWENSQLIPYVYFQIPPDGIWDFDFVAEELEDPVTQELPPIVAHYDWKDFPTELKGVRIHASTNDLVLKLRDQT